MDEIVGEISHGEKLCDSIYQFYQPKVPIQLEVVFVHGLEYDTCGDAYWKTWLTQDVTQDNIWPMTWLPDEFPSAKVFALKYDASVKQTASVGRMDLFLVGEKLVQEMVMFGEIGQHGVPVVFVCHGLGGLVAKQIVIHAKNHCSQDLGAQKLLKNIGAILFYSTPHHGSHLAKRFLSPFHRIWVGGKGSLLENLEVLSTNISRLNRDFLQLVEETTWYFASAVETHETKLYGAMVVDEASSRFGRGDYFSLGVDHFDVVRPKTKKDSSYLLLTKCLKKVLDEYASKFAVEVKSLVLDSFVGLEDQEETIKRKLQAVSIVGLVGMGGIGKTTLARAMYQSICKDFDKSCYLDDIKSKANLDEVLITLLQKFGIMERKTSSIEDQSALQACKKSLLEKLKTYVQQHRVLVIMDDVGTEGNLGSLLKDMGFLNGNKESKVIVTCRNWQELKRYVDGSGKYELQTMSSSEAIELFIYHAFEEARTLEQRRAKLLHFLSKDSSKDLIDKFESKCDDVVKACGGLPLSLEVMGCLLGGYLRDDLSSKGCLDCWNGALEKLKHGEPLKGGVDNNELWKVLHISYECLHENEKNMFLDIACFFCDSVRYGEETLLRIWGGKSKKLVELRNLKERCLVKIKEEDKSVTMHDQLRDMGRSIVRQQGKGDWIGMTRLWAFEDVSKLLQSNEITSQEIQGLSLEEWAITPKASMEYKSIGTSKRQKLGEEKGFNLNCPRMRLLNLHEVNKNIIEAMSIEGSSCIQWLYLRGSKISKFPKFVQFCNDLCVLDMKNCKYLKNLDESIANLVNLLELNLSKCINLVSLPNSIGKLVKLSTLDVSSCVGFTSLPNSIGKLANLSTLDICGCKGLTSLPNSIGKLVKLSTLDISYCVGLPTLPNSIGELVNISELRISGCAGFTSLPNSIGELANLSTLEIFWCKGLANLPDSICKLANLSTLVIFDCVGLVSLPNSIGELANLSELHISYCKGLPSLPDSICKLSNLSTLFIAGCVGLTSLPNSIGKLANLSRLHISCCKGLTSLPNSIGEFANLSTLDFSGCEGLTSLLDSIGKLANLFTLNISDCEGLTSLPDSIGELANLSTLHISCCKGLTSLPDSIGEFANLSTLDFSGCEGLTSLPDSIGKLANLFTLNISYCEGLTSLPDSIGELANLSTLDISGCISLTSLPNSIGKLVNLSTLNIADCIGLTSLPNSIGKLVKLSKFEISNCKGLTNLPDSIGKLLNLSALNISSCKGLTSLPNSIG